MTTRDVFEVARNGNRIDLAKICHDMEKVRKANEYYMKRREQEGVYGDTTMFGAMVGKNAPVDKHREKQRNLVYSLNCGGGEPLREDQVRAAMFVRLLVLSQGHSGVRPEILDCLCRMLNEGEIPQVPSSGSIGASGDLGLSSYYAIPILNDVGLEGREGLALLNGTHFMSGISALAVEDFAYLCDTLLNLFAILFQCHSGIEDVFDKDLHLLKKHPEQHELAKFFREVLDGSKLLTNIDKLTRLSAEERASAKPIQDRYSLRGLVQELSPVVYYARDAREKVERELNSVSDNPVLIGTKIGHGAHFSGTWIRFAMESLKHCIWEAAYVARAHMRSITDDKINHGLLPMYLVEENDGLNNGLQGLVIFFDDIFARLEKDCNPDYIHAKNDHEGVNQDTVSMGKHSALSAASMVTRLADLTARLIIMTRQAVHLLKIEDMLSPATQKVYAKLAELIPPVEKDRSFHNELRKLETMLFYQKI